jgi:hypothetical protein
MNSWLGTRQMPLALNKYLYGHKNGINFKDSSGHFSTLGEFSTAQKISGILLLTIFSTGYSNLVGGYEISTSDGKHTADKLGLLTLIGMMRQSGQRLHGLLSQNIEDKIRKENSLPLYRAFEDGEMLDIWKCMCVRGRQTIWQYTPKADQTNY